MTLTRTVLTVFILNLTVATAQEAAPDTSWHLLTKTEGGTVSLLKGLSKHECEFVRARMLGQAATDEERAANKAAYESVTTAWEKWKAEHHCDESGIVRDRGGKAIPGVFTSGGSTSGPSEVLSDGMCLRGYEFSYPGEGWHMGSPGDIFSAECFQ